MSGLRNIAIRWYRDVFGAPAGSDIRDEGLDCVLDGNSAVVLSEAGIATHAALGGSLPSADADAVWLGEVEHGATNLFGEPLSAQKTEGPRGIIAAATGLAMAGRRATAFLSGTDIAAAQDLLISAAGKHVPLVLHVGTREAVAHGASLGSGHETVHLGADTGFFILFAANVQEAVDFTYIARRVAEESLVPGMVVIDGEQTALAMQDVRLLSPAQVNDFIGAAREQIDVPTEAQKLLFGETRRRVPAWHDLNEPVLTGALFEKESFALGALARGPFFDAFVDESLSTSFATFARKTGRQYETLSHYKLDDAKTVLLAQGAAVETARVAADCLRKQHKIKVGVLGIHALRPFPGDEIVKALEGRDRVFVLERTDASMCGEPPLTREVRASMNRLDGKHRPDCSPVVYGLGGFPLRVADLVELCTGPDRDSTESLFLGPVFDDTSDEQPKREVLLDALRRAYPAASKLGIRAADGTPEAKPKGSLTIAIHRCNGGKEILGAAGALLHALEGGRVRTRPSVAWERWSGSSIDWLTHGDVSLHDPGDDLIADITLDVPNAAVTIGATAKSYRIPVEHNAPDALETLLGGLFGVLVNAGLLDHKSRRIVATRKGLLDGVDSDRIDGAVAAFQSGLEELVEFDEGSNADSGNPDRWEGETPAAVRHLSRNDDNFASLPRFWDQTGVLYRDGQADRLTADPFLATGTMPPLSSTFNDTSKSRSRMPQFDPTLCTGCGKCWTHCPDSAIGVVAATPAALIDAGINRTGADAVRQVSSKLASRIISSNKKADDVAPTFGRLLTDAYDWLKDKMPLPEERKLAIQEGIDGIENELGELPVAVTQPFFFDAEATKKDSAELLSVVINPEACKACGICVANCEPEALRSGEQNPASLEQARELWSVFAATPDTSSETLERVAENPDIGSMAAILLSRYCQFSMAGGDAAEAGSGEKMAVKLALSATEFHQQPLVQRFAVTLAAAGESVAELINETLSSTLAVEDLDAVTEKLKHTASPRVDLKDLAESVGDAAADHSVDTEYLLRLIDLSKQIAAAHHRLVEGAHGLGRARYGLAVAGGSAAAWAGAFPHNPFQAPALVDMTGDAAQLAAGLIEGHLDETTDLVRLLRLARLEIDQPDGANWKREALASLRWQDLEKDELETCPPLLLIGSDEMLAGQGLSQLIWLLNSGLPVKVLVLSALGISRGGTSTNNPRGNLGLLALAQRNAYVAQTSIADPVHFGESVLQALSYQGPALLQVYAPSPARHGFPSNQTLAQAELAVASRALPLFRYDPRADGVFGSRISLDGNPESDQTLADWALGQERFASHFKPIAGDDEEEQTFTESQALTDAADQCLANWQTLQELAGVVTPFTERLEQEIRAELAAEYQAELDAQKLASAAEIREIQEKTQAEIAKNIRSRLLQLAAKKQD
jgi:pyruvate-ferredoxin/flavodoxin oxidoreductase